MYTEMKAFSLPASTLPSNITRFTIIGTIKVCSKLLLDKKKTREKKKKTKKSSLSKYSSYAYTLDFLDGILIVLINNQTFNFSLALI